MTADDAVQIRPYQQGDGPGIVALLNGVFGEGDPDYRPRSLAQWSWIYEQNPAGRQVIVAQEPGGGIVGHYACIPYRCQLDGELSICGQGVDSMVRQDYRRGLKSEGLFLRTARCYFETYGRPEHNRYGYGFPNRHAFRIGVRMLAYQPVQSPVPTLGFNIYAARQGPVGIEAAPAGPQPVAISAFGVAADRLWARLAAELPMGIVRDGRYLDWRYRDCALAEYRAFALVDGDGAWRAAYVLRENWQGVPIAAVAELLVPADDAEGLQLLLCHALTEARSRGQQRLELWLPPWHPHFAGCQELGMIAEESPYHLCVKVYGEPVEQEWLQRHWFYSIGDSDSF